MYTKHRLNTALKSLLLVTALTITHKSYSQFSIGLRTGINSEMMQKGYFQTEKSIHTSSWSQQLYANWNIGKHFLLEANIIHTSFNKAILPLNNIYYTVRSEDFNAACIISYKVLSLQGFKLYTGLGIGTYNNLTKHNDNHTFNIDAPSGVVAATGIYQINHKFSLSAQGLYSNLLSSSSGAGISNLSLNVGAGYTF